MNNSHRRTIGLVVFILVLAGTSCVPTTLSPSPSPPPSNTPTSTQRPTPTLPATPTSVPSPTMQATQAKERFDPSLALLPAFSEDVNLLESVTHYSIDLAIAMEPGGKTAQLEGDVRIQFTNAGMHALDDVALMLWPNDDQYLAEMQIGPVQIDGEVRESQAELGGLAVRVPLDEPLAPGDVLDLRVPYTIQIESGMNVNRPRRMGITEGALIAPTFYPLLPPLIEGQWQVEAAPPGGDTTNSAVSFYTLTIRASPDHTLIASGSEVESKILDVGLRETTYVTGPMRDVALALGPYKELSTTTHDVTLHAWYLPDHEQNAERMLDAGARQFGYFWEWVGPYPYQELDMVDAPGAFGGIEYPGLVYIGTLGGTNVIDPTVHEVAHQWFYGLVGNDQHHDPWLDEAAATYSQLLYYERHFGSGAAAGLLSDWRLWVQSADDPGLPIGQGVGEYDPGEYVLFVYLKGALFLERLRAELGDDLFFKCWQTYYDEQRYQLADSADFQKAAEEVCDCDLDPLFDLWVYDDGDQQWP